MFRRLLTRFTTILFFLPLYTFAQNDSSTLMALPPSAGLRISLLTCGVGNELYASFGHTGIRIIDSNRGVDEVYNYGTFNGYEENFELKFMRGKLLYYLSVSTYDQFLRTYVEERRSVQEQELIMTQEQKKYMQALLEENLLPQNRGYKYDFLFDNCATRVRDLFPKAFGPGFRFGQTLDPEARISFRQMINHYLAGKHWERFGINLLLGTPVDRTMKNEQVMFLPDYLRDGVAGAQADGRSIAAPVQTILPSGKGSLDLPVSAFLSHPLFLTLVIAALTIAGLLVRKLSWLGSFMSTLLLVVTGLLGCLMLVMWFGTDHQACQRNWNVLWALPTNLILPFVRRQRQQRYALLAICLLLLSLLLHVLRVQQMSLPELAPLLLALLFVYGTIYKSVKTIKQ